MGKMAGLTDGQLRLRALSTTFLTLPAVFMWQGFAKQSEVTFLEFMQDSWRFLMMGDLAGKMLVLGILFLLFVAPALAVALIARTIYTQRKSVQ